MYFTFSIIGSGVKEDAAIAIMQALSYMNAHFLITCTTVWHENFTRN